jgi:hypothetical protein
VNTEKLLIRGEEHEIEVKPINLIFNSSVDESVYLDRIMITPDMTLEHFKSLKEVDPYSARFFKIVVPDFPYEITKEKLEGCSLAFQHIIGLFSLSFVLLSQNIKFGWKYPESFLHPKYQGNIADALIAFSDKEKFIRIITEVKEELLKKGK